MLLSAKYIKTINNILVSNADYISISTLERDIILNGDNYFNDINLNFINSDDEMYEFLKYLTAQLLSNDYIMALPGSRAFFKREYAMKHQFHFHSAIGSLDILIDNFQIGNKLAYTYDSINNPEIKEFIDIMEKKNPDFKIKCLKESYIDAMDDLKRANERLDKIEELKSKLSPEERLKFEMIYPE